MKKSNESSIVLRKTIILGSIIVILFALFAFYSYVQAPKRQAQKQAYALAQKYAHVNNPTAFYWYNRDKTYFTVAGTNNEKEKVYVIIFKNGNKINIYSQNKGISASQATKLVTDMRKPKKIINVALGMRKSEPVWEVSYRNAANNLCYDLISFKDGEVLKTIQNI